ncbi:MAG: AbrB/MazE/SpoVT family DNA-binding domain-containing protein [Candidatus Colwellbacteria bacterium]
MTQKVLRVGSSAAVTIPKRSLEDLGLKIGDRVAVEVNIKDRTFMVKPVVRLSKEDQEVAEIALRFIEKHRKDLEALAEK